MAMGEANPLAMQLAAQEPVWTSASVAALGGRTPTGVGPPLRASLLGDGHHWPPDASHRNVAMQPTLAKALSPGRSVLQQTHVHLTPAKGGSSTIATTLVASSPYANRSPHDHQQSNALPANAHLPTTYIHSTTVRQTHTPNRAPIPTPNRPAAATSNRVATATPNRSPSHTPNRPTTPTPNRLASPTPVQSLASNTDVAGVKTHTLRTNPHPVPFLDEEQQRRAATRAATGKSPSRKAVQPVQFPQGFYPIPLSGQGAAGVSISRMSMREAIDLECYEQQRKQRLARHFGEEDRMNEDLRRERT